MKPAAFYDHVATVMALPAAERHPLLVQLHSQSLRPYQTMLNRLTAEQVRQPQPASSDTSPPGTALRFWPPVIFWRAFSIRV